MGFDACLQEFIQDGNFLTLTTQFKNGIPEPKSFVLANGVSVKLIDTGILQIEPTNSSSISLLISSGIHGNETAPIEIVQQMVKDIWSGWLEVKVRLMLIIGNPPSIKIGERFLSQNLNRLFSGYYKNSESSDYETERAQIIEQAVSEFYNESENSNPIRYHFDLHTAIRPSKYKKFVVYPFLDERPWDKNHIAFFGGADITTVLLGHQPSGTFSYYTSNQFRALSATVELGKVKPFGENDMQDFSGIVNNMQCLIEDKPPKNLTFNNHSYKVFHVKNEIIKVNEDYRLLLDDEVQNFTSLKKGTVLASDGYQTHSLVEDEGYSIVFPNNNVPIGQRLGVLLEEIDL